MTASERHIVATSGGFRRNDRYGWEIGPLIDFAIGLSGARSNASASPASAVCTHSQIRRGSIPPRTRTVSLNPSPRSSTWRVNG